MLVYIFILARTQKVEQEDQEFEFIQDLASSETFAQTQQQKQTLQSCARPQRFSSPALLICPAVSAVVLHIYTLSPWTLMENFVLAIVNFYKCPSLYPFFNFCFVLLVVMLATIQLFQHGSSFSSLLAHRVMGQLNSVVQALAP